MTVVARRLWLYGLLLFLPALAVGGLALGLLARERARLEEREQTARESRRAAVESRARLIAENIELLVGDVQSALMTTLLDAPEAEPRAFLTEWQATNPLVRDVFRSTAEGHVVWGATGEPLRGWLGQGAPWGELRPSAPIIAARVASSDVQAAAPAPGRDRMQAQEQQTSFNSLVQADPARKEISYNVSQYKTARQAIQEVAKVKNYSDALATTNSGNGALEVNLGANAVNAASPAAAAGSASDRRDVAAAVLDAPGLAPAEFFQAPVEPVKSEATDSDAVSKQLGFGAQAAQIVSEPLTRSGWIPWRDDGGLHLFGWRELPDRTVIGLELRLDAIKARLGEVFPASPEAGESFELRDATGAAWHRIGPANLPVLLEVPLAAETLPGWTIVARLAAPDGGASAPNGFFLLGAALIGLLVLAILGSGALLVRQVRLSEIEAARKTSFVANVSHELKTPLTTIRLYAELLAEGRVRDEAKRADYLATIGQETQRLGRLIANVLDFSRLEQGKKKYDHGSLDLAAELRRLADMHGPRLSAAGLSLRVEAPDTLAVITDRDAVEQIVLNLLDNACKYAAEGGEVLLRLSADTTASASGGARARLVVADRGPGVPDGQRERIFEKFHRVDDRLTAEKAGAGLGLSIARQLARGLGGDLRCEARADGGGAAFVLTLPISIFP